MIGLRRVDDWVVRGSVGGGVAGRLAEFYCSGFGVVFLFCAYGVFVGGRVVGI